MNQLADTVLMIQPTSFGYNEEAAASNSFQNKPTEADTVQDKALEEFSTFKGLLESNGVKVLAYTDTNSNTPDSIFPNNWFSTHESNELVLYPMAVPNRRAERRPDIIKDLVETYGYQTIDFSEEERSGRYLEGTGSLIFDHQNRKVYAAISPRTNRELVEVVADKLGYEAITFEALGKEGELIYHTNVMLCIGLDFVIIGSDTIVEADRERVLQSLSSLGKKIIEFSNDQIYNCFAGNMLQIKNSSEERILVISEKAFKSLTQDQLKELEESNEVVLSVSIPTIEAVGGGSVRCMLAEIFHS